MTMTRENEKNQAEPEMKGEEITQEQMEAEARVREQMDADRVAVITRGIAQGLLSVIYEGNAEKPKQSDPVVQLIEPIMDAVYFVLKDIQRAADAQDRIAKALQMQVELMVKMANPPVMAGGKDISGDFSGVDMANETPDRNVDE